MHAFATHFSCRARLKRLSYALCGWYAAARTRRRLQCCMRRAALSHRNTSMSTVFSHWAAVAEEQSLQGARSSSTLQQQQLQRMHAIIQNCRLKFAQRISRSGMSLQFGAWRCFAKQQRRLRICASRVASLHEKACLTKSFFNWTCVIAEHKQQAQQSATTALHQEQLQRSRAVLQLRQNFFAHLLFVKDAASVLQHAFKQWLQCARAQRRACIVGKKFVLRYMNQCAARAFYSWTEALRLRSRSLKLADLMRVSHNRAMGHAFVQWSSAAAVEKALQQAAQQVCAHSLHIRCAAVTYKAKLNPKPKPKLRPTSRPKPKTKTLALKRRPPCSRPPCSRVAQAAADTHASVSALFATERQGLGLQRARLSLALHAVVTKWMRSRCSPHARHLRPDTRPPLSFHFGAAACSAASACGSCARCKRHLCACRRCCSAAAGTSLRSCVTCVRGVCTRCRRR